MAYCTQEQVADEFNGVTFDANTNPTETTVDRWIAEADQLINAKVGLRYTVPLNETDHPNDIIILRTICIELVAARVRRRLNRVGPNTDAQKVIVTETDTKAMKKLTEIAEGKLNLSEASPKNSDLGVSSHTVDCADPFTFERNVDQW
jgi:phage gp36-like protein